MVSTRTGVAMIVLSAALASASVMAWAARAHRGVFAERRAPPRACA